jgi:large repetitive protein
MSVVPTITSVVGGNASAAITFTAASIPGDTVQYYGYQVSTSTDFSGAVNIEFAPRDASSLTQTATQFWNGAAFVPLSNGTTYYFKVLAAFASAGWGGSSATSSGVQLGLPSAPSSLVVTKGNQSGSIAFTAGGDGGSAITNYQYSTDGTNFTAFSPAQTSSPVTISGLTNGTSYTVYLKAVNAVGVSPASTASNSFTPSTTPSAPTSLSATAQNGGASISFTAGSDGGSAISNYQYSTDGSTYNAFSPAQTTSPVTITGLNNGTAYNIYLKAVNANGAGTASSSVAVTPSTTPDVPTSLVATGGNQSISVSFTGGNGGSAIDNYQYSTDSGATFRSFAPAQTSSPVSITTLSSDGVTTLTNGTLYTVQLKAHNANGYSAASASASATPSTTPSAPTSLVALSLNQSASISFTAGANGGSPLTNYKYSTDGTNYTAFSPAQTSSPVTISGLTNGTAYTIYLKAVNANGDSAASSSVAVTPSTMPDAPRFLVGTAGNQSISVSFTAGASNGGAAVTNQQYSTDNGVSFRAFSPAQATSPVTITTLSSDGVTALTNGTSYTIQLKAVNVKGASTASTSIAVTPSTTPSAPTSLVGTRGDTTASIAFTAGSDGGSAITNYQYSINGGSSYLAFSPAQTSSPVTISGLTNGTAYTILLKTVNANGASAASSSVVVTPSTTPSAPTSLVVTSINAGLSIAFTAGSNGGSALTNYQFSVDGGSNFQAFSPAQTTSPVTISGLINGVNYTVALKAVNANGASSASSTASGTPSTVPNAPTSLSAATSNQTVTVSFTPGFNQGAAITNYQYTIDGVNYGAFIPAQTTSPVTISGLTNGTTYTIGLKEVNVNGPSVASSTITATPSTVANAPTSLVATPGNQQISIAFTPGANGGSPITNYKYSTDGTNYTAFSPAQTTSPVLITALTNGTSYTVYLKEVNANGDSVASSSVTATPSTVPNAPTSLSSAYGNGSASISFTAGSNGGSAITNYQYSLDGTNYTAFSPAQTSSPVSITGLTNGTAYTIYLKTVNANGASVASSGVAVTPSTVPNAPSSLSANGGNASITVTFTPGTNGGSAITNYQYSTDSGSTYRAFSPSQSTSPVSITTLSTDGVTPLTNGVAYTLYLKAVNVNGASTASSSVVATPGTTPSAPTSLVASNGNQSVSISFTEGFNGGRTITNYQYSLDNGASFSAFSPAQTVSPVIITGLTNGTSYYVVLKAVNSIGAGTASTNVLAIPSTLPSAPTSLVATAGNQSASIAFTAGSNGGLSISNYQYSFDGTNYVAFSPAQTTSPVTVSGLNNGQAYTIYLKAVNANGAGAASSYVSVTPSTTPSAPTSLVATSGNAQVSIAFTPGNSGGLTITNYKYSLDGTNYTAFSPAQTTSPVTITGLTNGTSYTIYLKQVNANGDSPASSPVSATPGAVPSAPTSLSAVDTYNGTIAVSFTPGSNGGWAITNYQYSLDGGSSFSSFSPAQTTSPVTISGLSNRTNYTIQLRALNVVGTGAASASLPLYYMCFLEGTEILCHSEGNSDEYRKIEDLRKGDLVKTFMDGYKAIDTIGFTKVYNPGNAMRSKNRLYKCTPAKYPGVTKDLFITGCHSVLVDELTAEQEKRLLEEQGKIYITDNHYRLMACVDERAEPYTEEGLYTVWHLALENDNYYYNYGIFANGLHVETTSKRMIKEQSGMTLKE